MKKLFKQILKLFLITTLIFSLLALFGFTVIKSQYTGTYQASIIEKENRLLSIKEPKIILVGNSNLTFGINSEMIENEFSMPVVNLGLHGGLGNSFHEEMSKLNIRTGDIVLVAYSDFSDNDKITDTELAWETIEYNYDLWKIIRIKDWPDMIAAYPKYLLNTYIYYVTKKGNADNHSIYSRSMINKYGDSIFDRNRNMNYDEYCNYKINIPIINDTFVERVNKFNDFVESKGATLLLIGYPIMDGDNSPKKIEYKKFTNDLKEKLKCNVISEYSDYLIPYKYFYDTFLHLNNEGAIIRTKQLITDLNNWKNKNEANR